MRKLAALALVFSFKAMACPNLAGTYTCAYEDNPPEQILITQELKNGFMTYSHNGSTVVADNIAYPIPGEETLRSGTLRATCLNNETLSANLVGNISTRTLTLAISI